MGRSRVDSKDLEDKWEDSLSSAVNGRSYDWWRRTDVPVSPADCAPTTLLGSWRNTSPESALGLAPDISLGGSFRRRTLASTGSRARTDALLRRSVNTAQQIGVKWLHLYSLDHVLLHTSVYTYPHRNTYNYTHIHTYTHSGYAKSLKRKMKRNQEALQTRHEAEDKGEGSRRCLQIFLEILLAQLRDLRLGSYGVITISMSSFWEGASLMHPLILLTRERSLSPPFRTSPSKQHLILPCKAPPAPRKYLYIKA